MILTTAAAAAISFASLVTPDKAPSDYQLAQVMPFVSTQGVVAPRGQYMTTANGCSYQRTQAPGYPPRWILIVNPARLGLPAAPRGCRGMM